MRNLLLLLVMLVAPFDTLSSGMLLSLYYLLNYKNESDFPYSDRIDWVNFSIWLLMILVLISFITGPRIPHRKEMLLMMVLLLGSYKAGRVFFDGGGDHYDFIRVVRDSFIVFSILIIVSRILPLLNINIHGKIFQILKEFPDFRIMLFMAIFLPFVITPYGDKGKRLLSYLLAIASSMIFILTNGRGLILTLFIISLWISLTTSGRGTLGFITLLIFAAFKYILKSQTFSVELFKENAPFFIVSMIIALAFTISYSKSRNAFTSAIKTSLTTFLFALSTAGASSAFKIWQGNHWFLLLIAFAMSIAKELEESTSRGINNE